MHELALAQNVVDIVAEEARRAGVKRVVRVRLVVGALRAVVPELLRSGIEIAARGTALEGCAVEIEEVEGRVHCRGCGSEFAAADSFFACPACGRPGGEVLSGRELLVLELEGD